MEKKRRKIVKGKVKNWKCKKGKVPKWGEDFCFFFLFFVFLFVWFFVLFLLVTFQNDEHLFWVSQNGNFLPGKSILHLEKKSGKMTLPPQKNFPIKSLSIHPRKLKRLEAWLGLKKFCVELPCHKISGSFWFFFFFFFEQRVYIIMYWKMISNTWHLRTTIFKSSNSFKSHNCLKN